jgi:hypothetical protein
MIVTGEKQSTMRQTCPNTTLSTTNPTWTAKAVGKNYSTADDKDQSQEMYAALQSCVA